MRTNFLYEKEYEMPIIKPVYEITESELIGFNYARTVKEKKGKAVHFYLDDYQFERVWNTPERNLNQLSAFDFVLSPDFSLFTDMPLPLQIYNCYRKNWCAAYWQSEGLTVIPTVGWADERTFDFCFNGLPQNSIVSVSSVGVMNNEGAKKMFRDGYNAMMEKLHPKQVLFYGSVPENIEGNITRIKPFYESIKERRYE